MGLALCHSLPRDNWTRAAAAFAAIAFLLQFIALADAANKSRMSWYDVKVGAVDYAATPWEILLSSEKGKSDRVALCAKADGRPSTAASIACDEFLREMQTVVILTACSGGLLLVLGIVVMCCLSRLCQKNSRFLLAYAVCISVPLGCGIAALALVFERVKAEIETVIQATFSVTPTVDIAAGVGLTIVATLLYAMGFILAVAKLVAFVIEFRHLKQEIKAEAEARAREVAAASGDGAATEEGTDLANLTFTHDLKLDERMALRVVNDDWERQKNLWLERRVALVGTLKAAGLTTREARVALAAKRMPQYFANTVSESPPDEGPLGGTVQQEPSSTTPLVREQTSAADAGNATEEGVQEKDADQ